MKKMKTATKIPKAERSLLNLNSLLPSGLRPRMLSRLTNYLPLILIQMSLHNHKQTLRDPTICQVYYLLTMTLSLTFNPIRSLSITKMINKARIQRRIPLTSLMISLNLRSLKVHQTARSRSLLPIRLTSPTLVLLSQVTVANVPVIYATNPSLIVDTRLNAKTVNMIYALSAARKKGKTI
jgi:hypothetical protein